MADILDTTPAFQQPLSKAQSQGMSTSHRGALMPEVFLCTRRFGDTAANAGALAFLRSNPYTKELDTVVQSAFASVCAALFRIILTPVDTVKTTMQTNGKEGLGILRRRVSFYLSS